MRAGADQPSGGHREAPGGAREEVLGRIRTALADGAAPPPVARDYRTAGQPRGLGGEELLELLVDRLVDYRALVRRGTTALVAATVVAALTERGARRVAVPEGILPAGLDRLEPGIELVADDPPSPRPSWTAWTASSPAARWPWPRRARSSSTAGPARAGASSAWSPTTTWAAVTTTRW